MAEQKLNIVFTGDVSQLTKAIQSAEAELTSFENKLKDSLGTEAFASINQSVDQLRQKFKTLSTIDIKANPQQALTAINEVLTGVAKIKSNEVFLKANNKDAIAAIQQVESFARSIRATIDVGFDTSEVTAKIEDLKGKLTGLEADVSIRVSGLDKLNAEILEVKTEINSLTNKKIFIDTDTAKAQDQIKILEAQLLRLEKISVSPDITIESKGRVEALAADIQKRLSTLKAEVEITADSAALDQTISNLKGKLSSLEAQVQVESVGLEQVNADLLKTRSLINTFEEIKLIVDSGDTIAEINRIEKELGELEALVVTPDISETQLKLFSANIDTLKLKLSELQKIPVSLDTSGIGAAIDAIKAKALSVFEIDISADPSKALAAIDAVQADIDEIRKNKILLEADNAPALAAIDKLESEIQGLKAKITLDPSGFDTSKLQNLIKPLSTQVSIGVNTRQAEVEIKALLEQVRNLKGQDILINLDGTQVVRTIDAIEKELLELQSKLKLATDPREIAKLTQSLQTFKNSLSATNVNQFSSTMNRAQNATFAFSQVLREAPAFAFSFQTGLLALSNNLPILADRFKEARASGLSFGKILGDMGKSLFSLPGILTIASTAAIFLAGAFNKSGKSAKDFTEELEDTRNVISDSAASVQGDIARVQALANAFKESEGSFERQKRIITELKSINESYFGDLKAGVSTYADITKAANAYTDALVQEAVIKGLSNAISKLSEQLGDATIKYADATKAADDQRRVLEATQRANRTNVQGLTAQNREVNTATNRYNNLQGALKKAGEEVGAINTRIEEFRKLINLKVFEQLKIKPLVDPKVKKDFEKDTDDIVARARLFAKEFGEIFVVPDLDESFTNTKDKIKASAVKLFDDLAKGKLKIRIPVQVITETDFIPETTGTPLSQAELDKLHTAYIEQLRKAFEEPFVFDPSIELAIDNEKIKKQFADAIKNADFQGALAAIDLDPKTLGLQGLNESLQQSALLINETLTPAFQSLFDAIIQGEDPLKAFFNSIIQSINQVIQRLIAAAVQAAILTAITGGGAGFGKTFLGLIGGLTRGGVANPGGFVGQGSLFNPGESQLVATVRGTDMQFVLTQGQGRIGRTQ